MSYVGFSDRKIRNKGPEKAQVLVVGEAPGEKEDEQLLPFVGASGFELNKMLMDARFVSSAARMTNVLKFRPHDNNITLAFPKSKKAAAEVGAPSYRGRYCHPLVIQGLDELSKEVRACEPRIIIAVGGHALWALTGKEGVDSWRGSELTWIEDGKTPVVPIYHPAAILRAWDLRHVTIHDLKKANEILQFGLTPPPPWHFTLRPNFQAVMEYLAKLPKRIAVDVETRSHHIVCIGIAVSKLDAICIPFVTKYGTPYWSEEEEFAIIERLREIMHEESGFEIIGQNFEYDAQFFARDLLVHPKIEFDTMLAQHALFPGTPKDLSYLSSIYCPYHVHWKDDGKEWDPALHTEEQFWSYCCTDCVKTFEIMEAQEGLLEKHKLRPQADFLVKRLWPKVVNMMLRGVRVNPVEKLKAATELEDAIKVRQDWLDFVVGYELNVSSTPQMKDFFHRQMGVKPKKNRKTKNISLDKHILKEVGETYTILLPLVETIEEIRSLRVFLQTFARAPLDWDGRMRCSFNIGGTETFRFSSDQNPFGSGTNLQNIPKGDRSSTMKMPNMRKLFIPDEGYTICEIDLAGADAQVVAWEADDKMWKAAFRAGLKVHAVNAKDIFGELAGPDGKAEPYYTRTKGGGHATNYCGKPPTVAKALGIHVAEAQAFQDKWFARHPGVLKWHGRTEQNLATTRSVKNAFGFRRYYFERVEDLLPEAVAWVPQSTIAIVANTILCNLEENTDAQLLLQVHDSVVFQVKTETLVESLREIHKHVLITIPYPDPLIIKLGLKASNVSWGAIEDMEWPLAA